MGSSYRRYLLTLSENGANLFDRYELGGIAIKIMFKRNPRFRGKPNYFKDTHTMKITDDETCIYSAEIISSTVLLLEVEYFKGPKSASDFCKIQLFRDVLEEEQKVTDVPYSETISEKYQFAKKVKLADGKYLLNCQHCSAVFSETAWNCPSCGESTGVRSAPPSD